MLEIISANMRNVHVGCLHVLQLRVRCDGASCSLRSSLRTETSARVLMQCSVHNCGGYAHSAAGHDTDAELMQLEHICYTVKHYASSVAHGRL